MCTEPSNHSPTIPPSIFFSSFVFNATHIPGRRAGVRSGRPCCSGLEAERDPPCSQHVFTVLNYASSKASSYRYTDSGSANPLPAATSIPECCRREFNAGTCVFRTHHMCVRVCLFSLSQLNIESEKKVLKHAEVPQPQLSEPAPRMSSRSSSRQEIKNILFSRPC